LKPKGLKAIGYLCLTRNSIGEGNNYKFNYIVLVYRMIYLFLILECYVTDEIITARSKKRIRIGNTDAEGRMAICDVLNEAKDLALNEKNPQLFTIATLTGHCVLSYGNNYSVKSIR
jgi:leucyl aminopeptidase